MPVRLLWGQTPLSPPVTITGQSPNPLLEVKGQPGTPGIAVYGSPALRVIGQKGAAIYAQSDKENTISVNNYWRHNDATSLWALRPVDSGYAIFAKADSINSCAAKLESILGGYALKTVGRIQLSGQNAAVGKVLTSMDADGNATWQDPPQTSKGGFEVITKQGWNLSVPASKNLLHLDLPLIEYNDKNSYQNKGYFVAPEDGVYHFDAEIEWNTKLSPKASGPSLSANGVTYLVIEKNGLPFRLDSQTSFGSLLYSQNISVNLKLKQGDKIGCGVLNGTSATKIISYAFFSGFQIY